MKKDKTGLEDFVGRHRADFDAFEPRPDLWDALEQQLNADAGTAEPAPLRVLPPTSAAPAARKPAPRRLYPYGIAATLALLVLAGLSVLWLNKPQSSGWAAKGVALVTTAPAPATAAQDNPFGLGTEPVASAAGVAPAQRAAAAVHRMEAYYTVQLQERRQELAALDAQLGTAPGDWQRELATLDSTYRQLKVELARNPEPDVVLDAMNRNLQIRLDILNQQLRTRAQVQEYSDVAPKP